MTICSNDIEYYFNTLQDINLGVSFTNVSLNVDNLPTLTATPTYFEFTGLNVSDTNVSRLVQNTTGSTVYITQVNIFTTDQTHAVRWNEWFDGGSCEHIIDVCSSNSDHPTDAVRTFFEAQDIQEIWRRYNIVRVQTGGLNGNFRPQVTKISYNPPVLLENNNYVRLFRNGSTNLPNLSIGVIGYY